MKELTVTELETGEEHKKIVHEAEDISEFILKLMYEQRKDEPYEDDTLYVSYYLWEKGDPSCEYPEWGLRLELKDCPTDSH